MLRLCSHIGEVCRCSDLEAQPCIAALIADYLDTIWWSMKTDGIDGGPGDAMSVAQARQAVDLTSKSCRDIPELRQWCSLHGVGLLERKP